MLTTAPPPLLPPQALLDECLSFMHERLAAFKANEVAVTLWAVARLRGTPDPRLMADALQHCFSRARQLSPRGLSMLMWAVSSAPSPPPRAWVAKLLVATQVRARRGCCVLMGACCALLCMHGCGCGCMHRLAAAIQRVHTARLQHSSARRECCVHAF